MYDGVHCTLYSISRRICYDIQIYHLWNTSTTGDEFVLKLEKKNPLVSLEYPEEWNLLKAFDRAFWLRHEKNASVDYCPLLNGKKIACPFNDPKRGLNLSSKYRLRTIEYVANQLFPRNKIIQWLLFVVALQNDNVSTNAVFYIHQVLRHEDYLLSTLNRI